jgi:hypothetical protein
MIPVTCLQQIKGTKSLVTMLALYLLKYLPTFYVLVIFIFIKKYINLVADSEFYMRSGLKDTRYCNKDIVQEQVYLIKTFRILYTRVFNPECENRIFPEGFHLAYTMLPRLSMRTNLKIGKFPQSFLAVSFDHKYYIARHNII